MTTIVLQVPDDSLATKVKQACKMLMGVASVKIQKEAKPRVYDPETGRYMNAKAVKDIQDAVNGVGVSSYSSLSDFYKEMGL